MSETISIMFDENGLAKEYDDAFDITIHCESEEAYNKVLEILNRRWIPVGERLPEVGSEVIACYEFKGKRSVYIADFYGDGDFHGLDDEYLTAECRKYRKAVAWMPLPEPYQKG